MSVYYPQFDETGSPPRGRGKERWAVLPGKSMGITPAWAGKSDVFQFSATSGKDHPRVGGEKPRTARRTLRAKGSPPRGRGKVYEQTFVWRQRRITPAWAGKSHKLHPGRAGTKDHPRVGGEKVWGKDEKGNEKGSPPRGRGKDEIVDQRYSTGRITPAWAGKRAYE